MRNSNLYLLLVLILSTIIKFSYGQQTFDHDIEFTTSKFLLKHVILTFEIEDSNIPNSYFYLNTEDKKIKLWSIRNVPYGTKLNIYINKGLFKIGKGHIILDDATAEYVEIPVFGSSIFSIGRVELMKFSGPTEYDDFPYNTIDSPPFITIRNNKIIEKAIKAHIEIPTLSINLPRMFSFFSEKYTQIEYENTGIFKKMIRNIYALFSKSVGRLEFKSSHDISSKELKGLADFQDYFVNKTTGLIRPAIYNYVIFNNEIRITEVKSEFLYATLSDHITLSEFNTKIYAAGQLYWRPYRGYCNYKAPSSNSDYYLSIDNDNDAFKIEKDTLLEIKKALSFAIPYIKIMHINKADENLNLQKACSVLYGRKIGDQYTELTKEMIKQLVRARISFE